MFSYTLAFGEKKHVRNDEHFKDKPFKKQLEFTGSNTEMRISWLLQFKHGGVWGYF